MITNKDITRYTNLTTNDSLSGFRNHVAQQSHNVYEIFYNFLSDIKPKRILEIGTALGGFTSFLKIVVDELKIDTKIMTLDIHTKDWYPEMIQNGIDVRVENVFNEDYSQVKQYIIDFIQEDGQVVVLCDGGNKKMEFNLLSKYLKINDFIMAHDYCESEEIFENEIKDKIWNWCELTEKDIQECSFEHNLKPFNQENFSNCVWVCKIKK